MENQLEWQEEYNIGVEEIDKEHRRLFKIINKLMTASSENGDNYQRTCQEGIKFFRGHTLKHFADEELYMATMGYEGLERHKKIHKGFREDTLPALEQELEQDGYSQEAIEHFLGVCTGWLIGHTLTEDQAIAGKHISKWEELLPESELEALKKVIIQLVFDLFHLESKVVSDTYGGEKFGRGVYYRLVYGSKGEDVRQEVLMVFEEKLLVNTVGKILGIQTDRMDSMLVHAARYTARQFVGKVMEFIETGKNLELKEENLLSFEQFGEIFDREKPQVSLLFNTGGAGYFAYCAIAPHLLDASVLTPLESENAMKEVEKYLNERSAQERYEEAHQHKKILVVDDSATIRQGMKSLLEPDYEILLADSGAAAFRAISLNQPDLVLLDYEMPVCDGAQTLEMLRTVPEFEKVPVIFLTGRRDPQSMIKVMPLNPSGYLLKTLKPEEIKKEVDGFFAEKEK
ncbi:response regulator [Acutalibacter muris]|uniref:Stage 0 sporulation protein A homolog n=1 Tax=Acutalibacter muris TaxID=1796620 RepID=A0A1Z2XNW7_9FIRM|nr:hemerythrin domain-containing protein [Acutalibacter muris]ANU53236.1 hemerythrin [Hungateiclostridiaceae bacterium KB18]ASB40091.1 hemerythrin [Acutalibacter muris]QQR29380.1 response regulator [Acutalibacter muris]